VREGVREGRREGGREGGREGRTACLDHVRAVVVQVPELPVVLLMRPPEGVLRERGEREREDEEGGGGEYR
jgi:hypothetical protein